MKGKIEFQPPESLKRYLGEGMKPGQKIELLTTYRVKENGELCVAAWDETVAAPGYDEKGEPVKDGEGEQQSRPFKDKAMSAMKEDGYAP